MSNITARVSARASRVYGVRIHSRRAWGTRSEARYQLRRISRRVKVIQADTLFQHITVTNDSGPRTGDFLADMRTIERIGIERFGSGVSYNFVVDMATGEVGLGMPLDAKGTHTVNNKGIRGFSHDQNAVARAIAVLGQPDDKLSARAELAIAGLIAAMMDEGALTDGFDYVPHSLVAWKDCPCDATRDRMPAIRARAVQLRKRARA